MSDQDAAVEIILRALCVFHAHSFSSIMIPIYRVILALKLKKSLLRLSLVYAGLGVSMAVFLYHGFVMGHTSGARGRGRNGRLRAVPGLLVYGLSLLKPITATVCITNVLWVVERLSPAAHSHIRQ